VQRKALIEEDVATRRRRPKKGDLGLWTAKRNNGMGTKQQNKKKKDKKSWTGELTQKHGGG